MGNDSRTDAGDTVEFSRPVARKALSAGMDIHIRETATDAEKAALARLFDALEVRRFRIAGTLKPSGASGWMLDAMLTATVVQQCVVTLEPVVTELSERVRRRFVPGGEAPGKEVDIDIDDPEEIDDLDEGIDIGAVAVETAALALPPYPRAEGVVFEIPVEEQDETEEPKPFAALAALKDKLEQKD